VLPNLIGSAVWSLDSYQRGYLSSTATSHITFHNEGDDEPEVVRFKQTIDQVPHIDGRYATIKTVWVPDADIKSEVEKLFDGKEPVVMNTALNVFGEAHTTGEIAPINQPALVFSGGTITIDGAASGKFSYNASFDSLDLKDKKNEHGMSRSIAMKGIVLNANGLMDKKSHIAWDSQFAMKVASFTVENAGTLHGITLSSDSRKTGDDFDVSVGMEVAKADFVDSPPAFHSMNNLKFKYGVSRINAPAVEAIIKKAKEAAEKPGQHSREQFKQELSVSITNNLPALLNAGPIFNIDPISFEVPDGTVAMHFSAELPPGHGDSGAKNPMLLLGLLDMKGGFSVPVAVYKEVQSHLGARRQAQSERNLQDLIKMGFITQADGMYKMDFTYKSGKLVVSGQPVTNLMNTLRGG